MRTTFFRCISGAALLSLAAVTLAYAREPGNTAGMKIRVIEGRPIVSGVFIEGRGPFTFLLDTGAQANSLAEPQAALLNWKPAYRVEVSTVAGLVWRGGYVATHVELGPARAERQEFLIEPLTEIRRLSGDIQGVLGQAFLGQFDYLLDLRRQRLAFGEPGLAGGFRAPIEHSHGRMVASTNRGRLVIDSGVNTLILHQAQDIRAQGHARLATQAGGADALLGTVTLSIGGRDYGNVIAALVAPSEAERPDTDGLLPASLLGWLYVSNSGGFVIIGPEH